MSKLKKKICDSFFEKETIFQELKSSDNRKEFLHLNSSKDIFDNNVLISFASYRSEKPNWMNLEAIKYNQNYNSHPRISGRLYREVFIENTEENNEQWLEQVLVDSMSHVVPLINDSGKVSYLIAKSDRDIMTHKAIIDKINIILSLVLKRKSNLVINHRTSSIRLSINTETGMIPSLKHLSLGESILFNMFITILRHSDEILNGDILDLSRIKGIVSIDEIDMHLDSKMQYEVLPELIELFPNIQFIITTHSPLFVLGMHERFKNNCDFINMPDGSEINVEEFGEFLSAYNYIQNTNTYQKKIKKDIKKAIENIKDDSYLIITEGSTDWMHMKNAYNILMKNAEFKNKFGKLNFQFYEYQTSGDDKIDMGDNSLLDLCKNLKKIPNGKYICIFDRDKDNIISKVTNGNSYKKWSNNVYSFAIPCPKSRENTPKISIEHYYSDKEIKSLVKCEDGINRRLFMGNEFRKNSFSVDGEYLCENKGKCGPDKICIIDGEENSNVKKLSEATDENMKNYALSKMNYVKAITKKEIKISKKSYDNFIEIFTFIKEIIENN